MTTQQVLTDDREDGSPHLMTLGVAVQNGSRFLLCGRSAITLQHSSPALHRQFTCLGHQPMTTGAKYRIAPFMADYEIADVTSLTVELLTAYLTNNCVSPGELAGLIRSTRSALCERPAANAALAKIETYEPIVSVRKSLADPEHILSLIDGKPYKSLKRHLAKHGLTPQAYRERYDLPASYPVVAPAFAQKRRVIAEAIGLGGRRKTAAAVSASPAIIAPGRSS